MNAPELTLSYDLHTHSTISDGSMTPKDLVIAAAEKGIDVLGLTDHDCTNGFAEACSVAESLNIKVIGGVEISCTWQNKGIHIVGINVKPDSPELQSGLAKLQQLRINRALDIGNRLKKYGIPDVFPAVEVRAGQGMMITRTHFAQQLFDMGLATSIRDAFDRYLGVGKPGYVNTQWAELAEAVSWIRAAGGISVVAHPLRYKLTASWLRRLLVDFKEVGGQGIEVVSGTASPGDIQASSEYAKRFGLLASVGSDFHGIEHGWPKLGRLPPLPKGLEPVWADWNN